MLPFPIALLKYFPERIVSSEPTEDLDLAAFNSGQHLAAFNARGKADSITAVLYPNDNHDEGKEIRLKQQYFFVSATLQVCSLIFLLSVEPLNFLVPWFLSVSLYHLSCDRIYWPGSKHLVSPSASFPVV